MKWIGQHIWDYVSKFRNDVYLEDISTGTIASGGNLGLDSNNKIVKASEVGSVVDLTSEVTGVLPVANGGTGASTLADNSILTGTGTSAITAESTLTYNSAISLLTLSSTASTLPQFVLSNSNTDAAGSKLKFEKTADGGDDDIIGVIDWTADDDGGTAISYATMQAKIADASNNDEAGKLELKVTTNSTEHQQAFTATGLGTGSRVDVGLGYGAASTTTIAGGLTVNGVVSTFTNATSSNIYIKNTGNNAEGGTLQFFNERPTGVDGDDTGVFKFWGMDDGGVAAQSAEFQTELHETADGDECGSIHLKVANNGTLQSGVSIVADKDTTDKVDVAIGYATSSLTTIAGDLQVVGSDILGPTDGDLNITSDGNIVISVDNDNDESNQTIEFKDNSTTGFEFTPSRGSVSLFNSTSSSGYPVVYLQNTGDNATGVGTVYFNKKRVDVSTQIGEDNDLIGKTIYTSYNDNGTPQLITFAEVQGTIADASDSDEAGKYEIKVTTSNGSTSALQNALSAVGSPSANDVDVTIGHGATSLTTIAGDLDIDGDKITTAGNIEIETGGSGNITLDSAGDIALEVSNSFTANAAAYTFSSGGSERPSFVIQNTADDATGPLFTISNIRDGNGLNDNDILGSINFSGADAAGQNEGYAMIQGVANETAHGDECGTLSFQVANNGVLKEGIIIAADSGTASEVDVQIGSGTASTTSIVGNLEIGGDDITLQSATSNKPSLQLINTNTDAVAPELVFQKAANGADGDDLGAIIFKGDDVAGNVETFAQILGEIAESADGDEEGRLSLAVASHDGELQNGLYISSGDVEDEVDVIIGNGAASILDIAGDIRQNGTSYTTAGALTIDTTNALSLDAGDNKIFFKHAGTIVASLTAGGLLLDNLPIVFEGSTPDNNETTLTVTDPTADRTITLPDATGTVALTNSLPARKETFSFNKRITVSNTSNLAWYGGYPDNYYMSSQLYDLGTAKSGDNYTDTTGRLWSTNRYTNWMVASPATVTKFQICGVEQNGTDNDITVAIWKVSPTPDALNQSSDLATVDFIGEIELTADSDTTRTHVPPAALTSFQSGSDLAAGDGILLCARRTGGGSDGTYWYVRGVVEIEYD